MAYGFRGKLFLVESVLSLWLTVIYDLFDSTLLLIKLNETGISVVIESEFRFSLSFDVIKHCIFYSLPSDVYITILGGIIPFSLPRWIILSRHRLKESQERA